MDDNIAKWFKPGEFDGIALEVVQAAQAIILPLVEATAYLNPKFTIDLEKVDHSTLEFQPDGGGHQKMFMSLVGEKLVPRLKEYKGVTKLVVDKPRGGEFELHLFISGAHYVYPLLPRQF